MASSTNLIFANGDKMPVVGLGTWRAPDEEVENAVNAALEAGYRHIDCAPVYQNEKVIGKVLREWIDSGRLKRSDLFITTKLPPHGNRASDVEKCLRSSLADLQIEYVDLYLIHVPFSVPYVQGPFETHPNGDLVLSDTDHVASWKEFERFQQAGLIKHLGISNFNQRQIKRLLDNSSVKPEVVQVEIHVYLQQKPLLAFCKENGILVTAYSPLGSKGIEKLTADSSRVYPDLMVNPEVVEIANRLGKSPAQILLRYLLDLGVSVIPKSTNPDRLKSNIDLFNFELSPTDIVTLGDLDANIRICDFSFFKGIQKHAEWPFERFYK